MTLDTKLQLFNALKEQFISATSFDDYGMEMIWDESENYESDEDTVYAGVTIKRSDDDEREPIYLDLRINLPKNGDMEMLEIAKCEVNMYEDIWEDWRGYDHTVSELWRAMLWNVWR